MKIKTVFENRLAHFGHTFEEDEELLKRKDLSFVQRNCVIYRHSVKKISMRMIRVAELMIEVLGMSFKEAKLKMNSLEDMDDCVDFIRSTLLPLWSEQ